MSRALARVASRRGLVVLGGVAGLVLALLVGCLTIGLAPGSLVPAYATLAVSHDAVAKVAGPEGSATGHGTASAPEGEGYVSSREAARDIAREATRRGIADGDGTARCLVCEGSTSGTVELVCFGSDESDASERLGRAARGIDAAARSLSANGDEFSVRVDDGDGGASLGWGGRASALVANRLGEWGVMGLAVGGLLSAALALAAREGERGSLSGGGEAV